MNDTILALDTLHVKLAQLDSQIKDKEKEIYKLQEQRGHINYLIDNYQSIFGEQSTVPPQQPAMFNAPTYDANKDTRSILVDILKNEARKMDWKEIYEIFSKVKPGVQSMSMRVLLSQMNHDQKYPVKLIKKGADYRYIYGEK